MVLCKASNVFESTVFVVFSHCNWGYIGVVVDDDDECGLCFVVITHSISHNTFVIR